MCGFVAGTFKGFEFHMLAIPLRVVLVSFMPNPLWTNQYVAQSFHKVSLVAVTDRFIMVKLEPTSSIGSSYGLYRLRVVYHTSTCSIWILQHSMTNNPTWKTLQSIQYERQHWHMHRGRFT